VFCPKSSNNNTGQEKLMHDEYMAVLHASFATVFDRQKEIAGRFYENLFSAAPQARALFSSDLERQKEMFASMLGEVTRCAETPGDFADSLAALAESHRHYKIPAALFEIAGTALHDALSDVLEGLLSAAEISVWKQAARQMTEAMASVTGT
jgi:hemoglobin-like flavoprotein